MTCASPTQTMEVSATDLRWECPAPDKMDDIGAEELSGIVSGTQDVNGRVFASSSTSKLALTSAGAEPHAGATADLLHTGLTPDPGTARALVLEVDGGGLGEVDVVGGGTDAGVTISKSVGRHLSDTGGGAQTSNRIGSYMTGH